MKPQMLKSLLAPTHAPQGTLKGSDGATSAQTTAIPAQPLTLALNVPPISD